MSNSTPATGIHKKKTTSQFFSCYFSVLFFLLFCVCVCDEEDVCICLPVVFDQTEVESERKLVLLLLILLPALGVHGVLMTNGYMK